MSCGDLRSLSQITEEKKKRSECNWEKRRRREAKGEEPGPNVLVHAMRRSHNKDPRPRDKRPRRRGRRGGGAPNKLQTTRQPDFEARWAE